MKQMGQVGYMREEESRVLDVRKFVTFLHTEIGQRMLAAELDGRLRREQPFMLGVKANQIYPEKKSGEMIIVQGIIDAFFFEENHIVLIDYKTDFVPFGREKELVKKYRTQLEYYAEALERLTGKAVAEKIIYSFSLGKEVKVD